MKTKKHITNLTSLAVLSLAWAGTLTGHAMDAASGSPESFGSGGGNGQTGSIQHAGMLGGIGYQTAKARQSEDRILTSNPGFYPGQPAETELLILITPTLVNESDEARAEARVELDDGTYYLTSAGGLNWVFNDGPALDIEETGRIPVPTVYEHTRVAAVASLGDLEDDVFLSIQNINDDDFGSYAYDSLPDAWQVAHFGEDSRDAAPDADADGDDQDNAYEHEVGTDPTNPYSRFELAIRPVAAAGGEIELVFFPAFTDREYIPQYRTQLNRGKWQDLERAQVSGNGTVRTVRDPETRGPEKYYRIQVRRR